MVASLEQLGENSLRGADPKISGINTIQKWGSHGSPIVIQVGGPTVLKPMLVERVSCCSGCTISLVDKVFRGLGTSTHYSNEFVTISLQMPGNRGMITVLTIETHLLNDLRNKHASWN